jgi:DNA-binding NarL/FixJ family response regulator
MHLRTCVVALINWSTQSVPLHAMRAGIDGYPDKDIDPHEFEKALYKIRFGRRYISQAIAHDSARYAYGDVR